MNKLSTVNQITVDQSNKTPAIYRDVLNDLLNRYAKAVKAKDIDELDECSKWLANNIARFNRQDPELNRLLSKLKAVHQMAVQVVNEEIDSVKVTLEGARSTQQRDMAYSLTQINTDAIS